MPYLGLRGMPLVSAITVAAGMGWILFGIDNGSLGGVIGSTPFQARFNLNSELQGTTTGVFELGAGAGALVICLYGDKWPRRICLYFATLWVIVGGILQVTCFELAQLLVGRVVSGIGLGIASSTLPIWQSETSPSRIRGTVVAASLSWLIVGQLIAYWVDYGMVENYTGDIVWRLPFSLQIMAAVVMCALVFFMPESPRYLITKGDIAQARVVLGALGKLDPEDPIVSGQIREIEDAIELEQKSAKTWGDLLPESWKRSVKGEKRAPTVQDGERRRMLTAVIIQVMQAFSGSTVISYYVTPIFQDSVRLEPHLASLMSGVLQVWFLLASFGTWYLIERAGRRFLFMAMAFCMMTVMFVLAGMVKLDTHASGIVAAIMIFLYQAFFTWGWMAGVWIYSTEIMPLSWRTKGVGLAVAMQWLWDFVLLQVTPPGIANIGWAMYIIFALFNASFIPFVYFYCPETAGIPLESIDLLYVHGANPVKESRVLRRRLKEERLARAASGERGIVGEGKEGKAEGAGEVVGLGSERTSGE